MLRTPTEKINKKSDDKETNETNPNNRQQRVVQPDPNTESALKEAFFDNLKRSHNPKPRIPRTEFVKTPDQISPLRTQIPKKLENFHIDLNVEQGVPKSLLSEQSTLHPETSLPLVTFQTQPISSTSIEGSIQQGNSQVVIHDLTTDEVFVSPTNPSFSGIDSKLSHFKELLNQTSPYFQNKTIKIKSPELLQQFKEDKAFELPFNTNFKLSQLQLQAIKSQFTDLNKQSPTERKPTRATLEARALQFETENTEQNPSDSSETIEENNDNLSESDQGQTRNMDFKASEITGAIPLFSGKEEELETFINVCDGFHNICEEGDDEKEKAILLIIIKMRIVGKALAKIQPTSELKTWQQLRDKLKKIFMKPITYELAQSELATTRQRRNESVESFADRIQNALDKLNVATQSLTSDPNALQALQKTNEKQALQHFEQNLFNDDLRIRVESANKDKLSTAILFAKQKEISLKLNTIKICDFCKIPGHVVADCRKKNLGQPQPSTSEQNYRGGNTNSNRNYQNNYQNQNRGNSSNQQGYNRGGFNNNNSNNYGNNSGNRYNNQNNNGNGNNGNNGNRYNNNNGGRYGNNDNRSNGNRNTYGNGNSNNYNNSDRNRNTNDGNRGNYNNANGNGNNNTRSDTYYRDNRMQNYGNNINRNDNNQDQSSYSRNNPNNSNTGNNYDNGNTRNTNTGNPNPRPSNNQGNRGNIRTMQMDDEDDEYEMDHKMVATAQVHEKN